VKGWALSPTTVTAPLEAIHGALRRIARRTSVRRPRRANLGSYLEGPYFTPQNKGAHPPELFRELDIAELDALLLSHKHATCVALAPEKPGALQAIRHLKQRVYASCWATAPPPTANPRRV
jgi:N-acetylgalactosamine-6-phosphate deacetylase